LTERNSVIGKARANKEEGKSSNNSPHQHYLFGWSGQLSLPTNICYQLIISQEKRQSLSLLGYNLLQYPTPRFFQIGQSKVWMHCMCGPCKIRAGKPNKETAKGTHFIETIALNYLPRWNDKNKLNSIYIYIYMALIHRHACGKGFN
jgi:hypothetical protein